MSTQITQVADGVGKTILLPVNNGISTVTVNGGGVAYAVSSDGTVITLTLTPVAGATIAVSFVEQFSVEPALLVSGDGGRTAGLETPAGLLRFPQTLIQSAVPSGVAASGTVSANGALDFGTNVLPLVFDGGLWFYFPAGAVYAGSPAGSYWVVMTDEQFGTIYGNMKPVGWPAKPVGPLAPVVSARGATAYTAATFTETTLASMTVPGKFLGPNGAVAISVSVLFGGSSGLKYVHQKINGAAIRTTTSVNAGALLVDQYRFQNAGSESLQFTNYTGAAFGVVPSGGGFTKVDTTIDWTGSIVASNGANDYVILAASLVEVTPG